MGSDRAHPGIKAIISIGGEGNNNWGNACSGTNRAQFVQNLVGFATSNGFDGIDLDIEEAVVDDRATVPGDDHLHPGDLHRAHARGLIVSGDVITNWQGPW